MTAPRSQHRRWTALAVLLVIAAVATLLIDSSGRSASRSPAFTLSLDPGTPLSGAAPDFTLTDQFGAPVSLHSFRGRVVILAFNDSQCTTICPLTTTAMVGAKGLLGGAGSQVQLLGIDANPTAISIKDVRSYSEVHGMTHDWHFLTGSLAQLRRVWRAYHIDVAIERGQIDHTPALYIIDPAGRLAKVYLTQMSYSSVGQQAQLLAQEVSSLIPGHPRVRTRLSYAQIQPISPAAAAVLPRAGGGAVALGPGPRPRLFLFFATWDTEVTDLGSALEALARYQAVARAGRLPELIAVDEGSVEPSMSALPQFLQELRSPLSYPVAVDRSGRVADGYGVQDEPWYVLVSAAGRVLWYYDVATSGWLGTNALLRQVRAALARTQAPSGSVSQSLAGSPPLLAALHRQAGQLLGDESALSDRLRELRGYPVVINAWASWCSPCRTEFGLFASASARYGREVAFLGVDTDDSPGDARSFLTAHPVSYPSYQGSTTALNSIAEIEGLPTTIFIDRAGRVVYVHIGQYQAQGTLDEDLDEYELGR
ncbi:MAG TPA: redoxin domain-containing protein [Solirubrobacteraceae bacterium]|nr:redoxin domain-containing protein [Solirubrobacteraceae bacterium]